MGYELHITKAEDWFDSESHPIEEQTWRKLVDGDPELEITGFADAPTPGGLLRVESPGLTIWSGHPDGDTVWFDLDKGSVSVKSPDEAVNAKMIAVAKALGARVLGDEGELYE